MPSQGTEATTCWTPLPAGDVIRVRAEIVEEPVSQAYGFREYGARDPEGQLWYFHSPLA